MDITLGLVFGVLLMSIALTLAFLSLLFKVEGWVKWFMGYEAWIDLVFSLSIFALAGSTVGLFVISFAAVVFTVAISTAREGYGYKLLHFNKQQFKELLRLWLNGHDVALKDAWTIEEVQGIGIPKAFKKRVKALGLFIWRTVT